ncbi:hypothetical protein CLOBOL_03501 [Enterocloster bolteae ATCC BAA-613]|uniref:Uncharacterized protein n=1 Tax=Enterocloster bolteae (strain ATCC BAA-613 / DSM 15670 / CCUG 46953 / JCM 12243 / WAL 16351) TaxID=411902 RepID=A8RT03_ENTBW|nr:hypothetical protein CLOBOL_03501 [Enterocloster bolteae ATCC BAA-613]
MDANIIVTAQIIIVIFDFISKFIRFPLTFQSSSSAHFSELKRSPADVLFHAHHLFVFLDIC